jgi:hypothetical protein
VQAAVGKKDHVGAADVVNTEDRINVTIETPELVSLEVLPKDDAQLGIDVRMVRRRAWAHGNLPVDQFQADTNWILAKLEELVRGHLDGAYGGHHSPHGMGHYTLDGRRLHHLMRWRGQVGGCGKDADFGRWHGGEGMNEGKENQAGES